MAKIIYWLIGVTGLALMLSYLRHLAGHQDAMREFPLLALFMLVVFAVSAIISRLLRRWRSR